MMRIQPQRRPNILNLQYDGSRVQLGNSYHVHFETLYNVLGLRGQ